MSLIDLNFQPKKVMDFGLWVKFKFAFKITLTKPDFL